jgi:hypothetical protein
MKNFLAYYGRKWTPEFTCWDFVRLIMLNEFNITLQPHSITVHNGVARALAIADAEREKPEWELIDAPELNCVALFSKRGVQFHVGFMLTNSNIFHLRRNAASIVQPLSEVINQFETVAFYRHAKICQRD